MEERQKQDVIVARYARMQEASRFTNLDLDAVEERVRHSAR